MWIRGAGALRPAPERMVRIIMCGLPPASTEERPPHEITNILWFHFLRKKWNEKWNGENLGRIELLSKLQKKSFHF